MTCLICDSNLARPVWGDSRSRIDRCCSCGVFFVAERPCEAEMMRLYDGAVLLSERPDPSSTQEGEPPDWKVAEHARILDKLDCFGVRDCEILDVGCFSGTFLRNAQQRGLRVVGVEPNQDACAFVHKFRKIEVIHGSLQSARFATDRFSAVSFLDVIEHVSDPVSELREAFRITRPEGVLVLTTPDVHGLLQRAVGSKRRLMHQPWCPIDGVPWHLWGFTRETIALCIEKAGFSMRKAAGLEPSALSTNLNAGSSPLKHLALRCVARLSKVLDMSDRLVVFAQKPQRT